ncbi:hypothetical protein [Amycolatopsis sp. cmx-11-12]|uniref:aromatic-ring hydroxylase C-terminal domain-containing protein n=1 Tax=Amycolatopsis sp. cmx-11-12 TaxID=2785795 RepID=UPI00391831B8
MGQNGAVLVRPDRFIAWRSYGAVPDERVALSTALSTMLDRPAVARSAPRRAVTGTSRRVTTNPR